MPFRNTGGLKRKTPLRTTSSVNYAATANARNEENMSNDMMNELIRITLPVKDVTTRDISLNNMKIEGTGLTVNGIFSGSNKIVGRHLLPWSPAGQGVRINGDLATQQIVFAGGAGAVGEEIIYRPIQTRSQIDAGKITPLNWTFSDDSYTRRVIVGWSANRVYLGQRVEIIFTANPDDGEGKLCFDLQRSWRYNAALEEYGLQDYIRFDPSSRIELHKPDGTVEVTFASAVSNPGSSDGTGDRYLLFTNSSHATNNVFGKGTRVIFDWVECGGPTWALLEEQELFDEFGSDADVADFFKRYGVDVRSWKRDKHTLDSHYPWLIRATVIAMPAGTGAGGSIAFSATKPS